MKMHLIDDQELVNEVLKGLKENDNYCPCVINSKGKPEYRCPCEDFRKNKYVGETCHCGIFIKDCN